jgi:hypothetical protein
MWPVPKSLDQVVDPHGTTANDIDSVATQQGGGDASDLENTTARQNLGV